MSEDNEKRFTQILVPTRSAPLYLADGWEEVHEGRDVTTIRKPLILKKQGGN